MPLGPNPMTVECCSSLVEPGATARDTDLGDLTPSISVSDSVDANPVGSYTPTRSVDTGCRTTTVSVAKSKGDGKGDDKDERDGRGKGEGRGR